MVSKIIKIGIGLLVLVGLILVWGVMIEPRLIATTRYTVEIPDLPENWSGKEVAFIADLQVGMWLDNEWTVRRIIEDLLREKPAAVLIGGDFIYHPTEDDSRREALGELELEDSLEARRLISRVMADIGPLAESGIPTYAVLGNHDYAMETRHALKLEWVAEEMAKALEKAGIPVLQNQAVAMSPPGKAAAGQAPLFLVGIGAHYPGKDHVKEAFSHLPEAAPRLVMMHNPESFAEIPAGAAPLAMAGHTHGGQIRIPFLPSWSWLSIVQEGEIHSDEWIHDYGQKGNRLYVNRGIGFSEFPIRINCMPELTYFTLVRENRTLQ